MKAAIVQCFTFTLHLLNAASSSEAASCHRSHQENGIHVRIGGTNEATSFKPSVKYKMPSDKKTRRGARKYRRELTETEKKEHRRMKGKYRRRNSTSTTSATRKKNKLAPSRKTTLDDALEELAISRALSLEMKLREEFCKYDTDQSGEIDPEEVKAVFLAMGIGVDTDEEDKQRVFAAFWEEEMKRMDDDGNRRISFDEFVKYHNRFIEYSSRTADINWALNNLTAHVEWSNARIFKEVNFLADAYRFARALDNPTNCEEVRKCAAEIVDINGMPEKDDQLMVLFGCIVLALLGSNVGHSPQDDWERFVDLVRDGEEDPIDIIMRLRSESTLASLDGDCVIEAETMLKSYARVDKLHAALRGASAAPRALLGAVAVVIASALRHGGDDQDAEDEPGTSFERAYAISGDGLRGSYPINAAELFDPSIEFVNQRLRGSRWRGVTLKVGWLKEGKEGILCILFDTSKFSPDDANTWWASNKYEFEDGAIPGKSRSKLSGRKIAARAEEKAETPEEVKARKAHEAMQPCREAVENINRDDIMDLASLDEPPEHCEKCIAIVMMLLGEPDSVHEAGWKALTRPIRDDVDAYLDRLHKRDVASISASSARQLLRSVKKFYLNPDFNASTLRGAHPAGLSLFKWCSQVKRVLQKR